MAGQRTELREGMTISFGGSKRPSFFGRLLRIIRFLLIIAFVMLIVVVALAVFPEDTVVLDMIRDLETGR